MPRRSKLKVFRTAIGFHDAYVAAPSQKAALEAWGSDGNLFATGAAERVDDSAVAREALAQPGVVIRRPRGTMAEHIAALPKAKRRAGEKEQSDREAPAPGGRRKIVSAKPKSPSKPKLRPDRGAVDRAEAAITDSERRHEEERAALAKRQAEFDRERRKLEAEQARALKRLEERLAAARDKYNRAMRAWRGD